MPTREEPTAEYLEPDTAHRELDYLSKTLTGMKADQFVEAREVEVRETAGSRFLAFLLGVDRRAV